MTTNNAQDGSISNPASRKSSRARKGAGTGNLTIQIAEAAYYKAEARGFAPGYELEDWLEAEQEVRA